MRSGPSLCFSFSFSLSLSDFLIKHNPANPQMSLKLDSMMSPVAGKFSQEGQLLDLHTERPASFRLQLCPRLLRRLCS